MEIGMSVSIRRCYASKLALIHIREPNDRSV